MTAEEDRVAVEATAHGVGPDGLEYNNTPILMFKLSNGKLAEVTEALDPFEVLAYVEQLSGLDRLNGADDVVAATPAGA